jgi:hypothetical protein
MVGSGVIHWDNGIPIAKKADVTNSDENRPNNSDFAALDRANLG